MAVEQRQISPREKRRRAAEQRFATAKLAWTKATIASWRNEPGAEERVKVALREFNEARRALGELRTQR